MHALKVNLNFNYPASELLLFYFGYFTLNYSHAAELNGSEGLGEEEVRDIEEFERFGPGRKKANPSRRADASGRGMQTRQLKHPQIAPKIECVDNFEWKIFSPVTKRKRNANPNEKEREIFLFLFFQRARAFRHSAKHSDRGTGNADFEISRISS